MYTVNELSGAWRRSAARARVLQHFTWHRAFHAQTSAYASLARAQRPLRISG